MTRLRTGSIYRYHRAGWDLVDPRPHLPANGDLVRVCQPHGCPPNGTMGHCFVETLAGKFIGLVAIASLTAKQKAKVANG